MEKWASLTSHDHFIIQQYSRKKMPVLDNNNSRWQQCAIVSPSLPNPNPKVLTRLCVIQHGDDLFVESKQTDY